MNNFKTTIGIEVHAVVNSNSKMFSGSKSSHIDTPNTNINEIDLGILGTLPTVNIEVINKSLILANALHMNISKTISFDRKHYFYKDLPKGYQITQFFNPIGQNGYITINTNEKCKKINIKEMHMEEDTAKQFNIGDKILLDYNRCGMPLIEIVSCADINSSNEATDYLIQLKRILNFQEISDARLEEGSLRADINISIAPYGSKILGQRVEIKNLNSIANVAKAIKYEEKRQLNLLLLGQQILHETRRFDETTGKTIHMRSKETVANYHYIPEPNIPTIPIDQNFINIALTKSKLNPDEVKKQLQSYKLDKKIIDLLLDDYDLYKIFNYVNEKTNDIKLSLTWIIVELVGLIKKDNKKITQISNKKITQIINMINLQKKGDINSKQCKTIIAQIYATDMNLDEIIEKFHFKQITSESVLSKMLKEIIAANPNVTKQYQQRPERVEKMFIGLLMKQTKEQANPIKSINILRSLLKKTELRGF